MNIYTVVFDWDGTLVDDVKWVFEGVKEIFRYFNKPLPCLEEYKNEMTGGDYVPFYRKRGIREEDGPRDLLNEIMNTKLATLAPPDLFSDTIDTLQFFKDRVALLALISLREEQALKKELDGYNLASFFGFIRGDVTDKELILKEFMDQFKLSSQEFMFVSDTVSDIRAAQKLGIYSVAVTHGFNSREQLDQASPDCLVDNLSEIVEKLYKT